MAEAKGNVEKLKILTTEARASHPHVFKPSAIKEGDKPSYSIELLFDKKTTDLSQFQKPVMEAIRQKWGPDKAEWPSPLKLPYRDGDKPYGKKKEVKPEHKGMYVVRASSNAEFSKPHVVGRDPKVALSSEAEFYPGCYCRAALKAHAYTFADKDGVKFILDGVQFVRDGAAFGGKKPADQTFGVIEGDNGDESFEEMADEESFDEAEL
jgi:hypothetical protein